MNIKIFYDRNVGENADFYYHKAKKLKKKLPGIEKTIESTKNELQEIEENYNKFLQRKEKERKINKVKKKEWYEKFRWTKTSGGKLVVMGHDATTNEILIKKHTGKDDLVLHSEAPGSPFGIIKEGKGLYNEEIREAGQTLLCFSKLWRKGYGTGDFFCVTPEQVSKEAPAGEYMTKGSFMIYGEKKIFKNINLRLGFGFYEEKYNVEDEEIITINFFSGSEEACRKHCKNFIILEPGTEKYKSLNKKIKQQLKVDIEDLPKYVPNYSKIVKK